MKPFPYISITLALSVMGAWLGYHRALHLPSPAVLVAQPTLATQESPRKRLKTIQEIEACIREYLASTNPDLSSALRAKILAVDHSLLRQTWDKIASQANGTESDAVLTSIHLLLAEQDPMGTIQMLVQKSRPSAIRNQLWSILEAWSVRDPRAAWDGMMADTIPPNVREGLHNAFTTICENFSKLDSAAAFAAFLKLPPDHWLNDYAAEILCRDAATPARRTEMLQQLVKQPPGRLRTVGLKGILAFQTQNQSLENVGNWLLQQPLPADEKDTLIAAVAAAAAPDDPRAALTWLMANARPAAVASSLEKLTAEWAIDSPNDCAAWLKTLPPGRAADGALFAFVEEVMQHDPESAFIWTRRFQLPARREVRAKAVWEKWVTDAPVSASRFIEQLDAEERGWLNLPVAP
jgi:hypothetical protein